MGESIHLPGVGTHQLPGNQKVSPSLSQLSNGRQAESPGPFGIRICPGSLFRGKSPIALPSHPSSNFNSWLPPNLRFSSPDPALTPFGRFLTMSRDIVHGRPCSNISTKGESTFHQLSRSHSGRRHLGRGGTNHVSRISPALPGSGRDQRRRAPRSHSLQEAVLGVCNVRRRGLLGGAPRKRAMTPRERQGALVATLRWA